MQYILLQDCYRNLSQNPNNYLPKIFFNTEKISEEITNLKYISLQFFSVIIFVLLIFNTGLVLQKIKFDEEEEEDVVSTWKRRESLNKEIN